MSQAGFGDSSSQTSISPSSPEPQTPLQSVSSSIIGEPTTLFNALPRQVLEQELEFCNERSQQAQVLLRQAQEQLQLSQLVIQRQETLTQTLQSRIDQLERELQDVHTNCDELRDRLKRQQHHTSQLKAALERCLDTSTPAPNDMALSALESWSSAKLADEKITPVEAIKDSPLQNVIKIVPAPQPIELEANQEPQPFSIDVQEPEPLDEPTHLSMPAKTQPISPLIVRPHKASQGSPIAPNLPPLQIVNSVPEPNRVVNWRIETQPEQQAIANENITNESSDASVSSSSAITNSTMVSTVATPKFMQALYGNSDNTASPEREDTAQLAIANSSHRKAVTSLAAVQLPQFPPLPRRR
jgi:exonuclease VII large subunit